jgi:hypothetical protein
MFCYSTKENDAPSWVHSWGSFFGSGVLSKVIDS